MKFKFKIQPYQTNAVESVIDCFTGQINVSGIKYRIDPGKDNRHGTLILSGKTVLKIPTCNFPMTQLLENIHAVQRKQNLPLSDKLLSVLGVRLILILKWKLAQGKHIAILKPYSR